MNNVLKSLSSLITHKRIKDWGVCSSGNIQVKHLTTVIPTTNEYVQKIYIYKVFRLNNFN